MRLRWLVPAADIGMRGAQFGDEFADQIIQIAAMGHPGEERFIARADFVPVVAGHVGVPVKIALEAPGFVINLAPLCAGIDLHLHSAKIEFASPDFGFAWDGIGDADDGSGLVKHLRAILVDVVAVDAFEQNLVLALGNVIDVQDVLRTLLIRGPELAGFERRRDVEEFVFASRKVAQNASPDGNRRDAIADAIEIDLNGFDGFRFLFFFLFVGLLIAWFDGFSFLVVFLFIFGSFFLVTFGFEGRGFIGLQRDGENAIGGVVVKALIELADAGIEVARGDEVEIFAVVVEAGAVVIVEARGGQRDLLRAERIEKNIAGAAAMGLRIGKPEAVGRPRSVADEAVVGGVDQDGFLVVDAHVPKLIGLVPVDEFFAVGRPRWAKTINLAIGSDARFVAAHLRARVNLVFSGFVGEIGDPLAVRGPRGAEFMDARVLRCQRANAAVLGGDGEDVAASFNDGARAGRRDCGAANGLGDAFEFPAGLEVLGANDDGETARFATVEIVFIEQAAIFVDDGVGAEARPLDVEVLIVGQFFGLLRSEVVAVEVHDAVAVAYEIDGVAVPHGEHVHAGSLGQLFIRVLFQIVDGDRQAPAAAITFPGAKFLRGFEIRDLGAIRGEGSELAARDGQRVSGSSLWRDEIEAR